MNTSVESLPVTATYTRILLNWGVFSPVELLAGTSLAAENLARQGRITVGEQIQVFRNAARLASQTDGKVGGADAGTWALEFGRHLNTGSHGPLGFAALSAPTLGEGLDVFGQFACTRAPYLGFRSGVIGEHYALELLTDVMPLGELTDALVDIALQIALAYADAVLGAAASHTVVWLARPTPSNETQVRKHFRGHCEFGATRNALLFPVELRPLPCPLHDEATYRSSLAQCREALDTLLNPQDVLSRASNWLSARFDLMMSSSPTAACVPPPSLDEMASSLAMAPRTLIRHLGARGTSYRVLRDAQQYAVACRLLDDARFTIAEIGERLGYGDPANFGRAFRRQAGVTPGQYRRRH